MRDLIGSPEPSARLAVDYFVYRAAKEIGALAAALGGVDGLVFTATPAQLADRPFPENDTDSDLCSVFAATRRPGVTP